jgi:hypothetical protein
LAVLRTVAEENDIGNGTSNDCTTAGGTLMRMEDSDRRPKKKTLPNIIITTMVGSGGFYGKKWYLLTTPFHDQKANV